MIRELKATEVFKLHNINLQTNTDSLKRDMLAGVKKVYVVEKNGDLLGQVFVSYVNGIVYMSDLIIVASCRGNGLGTFLVKHVLDNVNDDILLKVDINNVVARHIYQKFGFKVLSIKQEFDGVKNNSYCVMLLRKIKKKESYKR